MEKILVINFGGTSSKVSLYFDDRLHEHTTIRHSSKELSELNSNEQQVRYRTQLILNWLKTIGISQSEITAISVRGGNIPRNLSKNGGTYFIDNELKQIVLDNYDGNSKFYHGIMIGVPIALRIRGEQSNIKIFITDPPTVNELEPIAKISGHPSFERIPMFHALNQKAVARKASKEINKDYSQSNFIIAHLGAGISVGAHKNGRVIDVNNVTRGDGPMAPNRAGQLPMSQLIDAIYENNYTLEEAQIKLRLDCGVKSYLGTDDMEEVERRIVAGDEYAKLIWDALVYQVAKEIGSCVTVLNCEVDAICYTGGLAYSERMVSDLNKRVGKLANILVYPGEFENEGLALGALRVLRGEEQPVKIAYE